MHVFLMPFAIPVIPFFFFLMSEHDGFSPHGTVFSPTASASLSRSLKMETRLAVHQLFDKKK